MAGRRFWKGFAAGAAAGAGAGFGSWLLSRAIGNRNSSILRLEKSVQIGKPIEQVFRAWSDLERLPSWLRMIENVQVHGENSHWRIRVDGRTLEWDAKITQRIPNQALGWKSLSGPKHTGRINFSPLGNDTEVHVVMNYAPPLRDAVTSITGRSEALEDLIAQALRDFKAALEGRGQEGAHTGETLRPTGTVGQQSGISPS